MPNDLEVFVSNNYIKNSARQGYACILKLSGFLCVNFYFPNLNFIHLHDVPMY